MAGNEVARRKLAKTRALSANEQMHADLQASVTATDLNALIPTQGALGYTDNAGNIVNTWANSWQGKLNNLLTQLVPWVASKVSTVNGRTPNSSGDLDLDSVYATTAQLGTKAPNAINTVYRHGPPTDPTAYPVGTFVVDVDDSNHLYEIGA